MNMVKTDQEWITQARQLAGHLRQLAMDCPPCQGETYCRDCSKVWDLSAELDGIVLERERHDSTTI